MSASYPLNWSELKIKYFEQIKYKNEQPQNLRRSTRYYLMKFDQFQAKPFWIDWNWAASSSGGFWSGLRGIYLPFFLIIFNGIFEGILPSVARFFYSSTFVMIYIIANILLFFSVTFLTAFSNRLYINKILKRIEKKNTPKPPHILNGFCFLIIFFSVSITAFPHLNTFALNKSCKDYLVKGEKSSQKVLESIIFEPNYESRFNNSYKSSLYTAAFMENPDAVAYLKEALKDPTFEPTMTSEDRHKIQETLSKIDRRKIQETLSKIKLPPADS